MRRIRVTKANLTSRVVVNAEGHTIPHAVRSAVRQLGLGAGKTLARERSAR